jgi:hypothetical protein
MTCEECECQSCHNLSTLIWEAQNVIYPNCVIKIVYIMTGLKYYNEFKNSTFYGQTVALRAFSIKHCYPNFMFKVLFRLVFNM